MNSKSLTWVIGALLVLLILMQSAYVVNQYQRAVVLRFGELVNSDVKPGLHFKIPFIDKVHIFEGRIQNMLVQSQRFLTKEQKALIVDSFTKWRVDDVARYYIRTTGDIDEVDKLLKQHLESRLRNAIGERTLQDVVSGQRDELMDQITHDLNQVVVRELGVKIVDVRLKAIDLPPQVSDSVFARMRSEREQEAQQRRASGQRDGIKIRAEADKTQRILLANAQRTADENKGAGDAKAAVIYADAYRQDAEFYSFYRSLDAYRTSFAKPNNILVLQPNSVFFRYFKAPKP